MYIRLSHNIGRSMTHVGRVPVRRDAVNRNHDAVNGIVSQKVFPWSIIHRQDLIQGVPSPSRPVDSMTTDLKGRSQSFAHGQGNWVILWKTLLRNLKNPVWPVTG